MSVIPTLPWSQLYPESSDRLNTFLSTFKSIYGSPTDKDADISFVVRSPGRVNIIGEHLDYSNFSVFPMAVERDLIMGVRLRPDTSSSGPRVINLANTDQATFKNSQILLPDSTKTLVSIDPKVSDWANYFRCGLIVGQRYLMGVYNNELSLQERPDAVFANLFADKKYIPPTKLHQLDVLLDGNIPTGSGLSSSAAFVVCSTLVTLVANTSRTAAAISHDDAIYKNLMVKLSMKCEQEVGVNTGGMDQAASVYGDLDHALYVSFFPKLTAEPKQFPVPPKSASIKSYDPSDYTMSFVIAHTLVTANKHETAPTNYNLRVVEVTLAALALAKSLNLSAPNALANTSSSNFVNLALPSTGNLSAGTLRDVFELYKAELSKSGKLPKPQGSDQYAQDIAILNELVAIVDKTLNDKYTANDLVELVGNGKGDATETRKQIDSLFFTTYPVRYDTLKLAKRARHVYSETARVYKFMELLNTYNADLANKTLEDYLHAVTQLGQYLDEAQTSLDQDFQCSCEAANELCKIARSGKSKEDGSPLSYGSRITGAGWGGATVHLTLKKNVPELLNAFRQQYYAKKCPNKSAQEIDDEAIICSRPANGSAIVILD